MVGNALHQELESTVQRWPLAAGARLESYVKRRLDDAVGAESRRLIATAQVELANRALARLFELAYEEDRTGRYWNLGADGRLLIATPWSRTQHSAYGLTDHQSRILRVALVDRLHRLPTKYQPLLYADGIWRVQLTRFPTLQSTQAWLAEYGLTPEVWQTAADATPRRGRNGGR